MHFVVKGKPQQQGSKGATKTGVMFEANKKLGPWRKLVKQEAEEAWGDAPLLLGPVAVHVFFVFERPKSHYGTGRNAEVLKAGAPYYKTSVPDLDKLERAIGDSLKGSILGDDSQIVHWDTRKIYGREAYASISITDLSGGSDDERRSDHADEGPRADARGDRGAQGLPPQV